MTLTGATQHRPVATDGGHPDRERPPTDQTRSPQTRLRANGQRPPTDDTRLQTRPQTNGRRTLTVIVGGLGAVGRMLRRELEQDLGRVVSIDLRDACDAEDVTALGPVGRELLARADLVVLAIPESAALAAMPVLAAQMAAGALLVDTLSVKTRFAGAIAQTAPRFEVASINPMFGPELGMAGRAVTLVELLAGARTEWFASLLHARGARIVRLSAEEHDRAAAMLQALPHVALLAFARALAECELDLDAALCIAPPPASAAVALAARIAAGNPLLYSEIQAANPFAPQARAALARAVEEVGETVTDADALADLARELTLAFGGHSSQLRAAAERLVREQRPPAEVRRAAQGLAARTAP